MSEENERAKQYKNAGKTDDLRRRRTETSIELRKQKRGDQMMKRRNLDFTEEDSELSGSESVETGMTPKGASANAPKVTPQEALVILQSNPSTEDLRKVFTSLRQVLSRSTDPPIDEVIQLGLVPAMIMALSLHDTTVQFEAAWALTNVVSGTTEQTFHAIQHGAVEALITLLSGDKAENVIEQSLWALANIVGDSAQLRDYVIERGLIDTLEPLMSTLKSRKTGFVRTVAWMCSNICRHKSPQVATDILARLVKGIALLLQHEDKDVRQDTTWALSYLTDGPDENIELAVKAGVLPIVCKFLDPNQPDSIVAPALRVLGNVATGNDQLTELVVQTGILSTSIRGILQRKSTGLVKESCWLISNIIAGTKGQIQAVINAGLLPLILDVLQHAEFRCQYEVSWALANLVSGGTQQQKLALFKAHGIPIICGALKNTNNDFQINLMETLSSILHACALAQDEPHLFQAAVSQVEENDGLDTIEGLQHHENKRIYDLAFNIISEYFNVDDNEEGELVEDAMANTQFQF